MEPEAQKKLIEAAITAREYAYAPYSKYRVGAALFTRSGKIFTGCNIENASIAASICSEQVAVFKAISEGHQDFQAIAIATENGGAPCGICRQVMREFTKELDILTVDAQKNIKTYTLTELLPHSFGLDDLKESGVL